MKTKYYLIQVFINNNINKINEIHLMCEKFEKKGWHYIINYISNNNNGGEFIIEVDKQTFDNYEF